MAATTAIKIFFSPDFFKNNIKINLNLKCFNECKSSSYYIHLYLYIYLTSLPFSLYRPAYPY